MNLPRRLLPAFVLLAACNARGPSAAPSSNVVDGIAVSPGTPQAAALGRLERETGARWTADLDPRFGTPVSLAGLSQPLVGADVTHAQAAIAFVGAHADLFGSPQLMLVRQRTDELGLVHVRLRQLVGGVPVDGAELIVHFDGAGRITSVGGRSIPGVEGVPTDARLSAAQAVDAAVAATRAERPAFDRSHLYAEPQAALEVWAGGAAPTLVWRIHLITDGASSPVYRIDAQSGDVVDRYEGAETIQGSGVGVLGDTKMLNVTQSGSTYSLVDDTHSPTLIRTYDGGTGSVFTSTSATSWDTSGRAHGAAVDAHFYMGVVYTYYKTTHNRSSIDDQGMNMRGVVHDPSMTNNAQWDGSQMRYGDGDGTQFRPFSAALDVVGHEMTHGVTQYTSNLDYSGSVGAMNESMSDIFGNFIEHFYRPDPVRNFWMGEDLNLQGTTGFRNAAHPSMGDPQQPDNMSGYVQTSQDNGGVHTNSGIPNNAWYLMTIGGTNDTSSVQVDCPIGWDKSQQLWYKTQTDYLMSNSGFTATSGATISAAQALWGMTSQESKTVECAWIATGVRTGTCAACAGGTGGTGGSGGAGGTGGAGGSGGTGGGDMVPPTVAITQPAG